MATDEGVHARPTHREVIIWGNMFSELGGCCGMASRRAVGNPNQGLGLLIINHFGPRTSRVGRFEAVDHAADNAVQLTIEPTRKGIGQNRDRSQRRSETVDRMHLIGSIR
jgi:hypothetical protein